ncbi:MAG: ACP S-malonyltransferase [Oscillospiraceae bacterium]|nr:ACP S-malonyltransferase [Oscillospiraceae bacterium]MDD4413601.1 ACP S-malonyltransferase [Oscillospiraceae bacterium]
MKIGFIYAGQGSQTVGMGRSLYENYQAARPVFDDCVMDFDLKQLCFYGPAEQLNQTRYTQPCMVAVAVAATCVLTENGILPDIAAGLSLGEYSALYAAGAFNAQTALSLTRFRGQVMESSVQDIDGKMTAVLGLERELLQSACDESSDLGTVQIANYNCPGQMVLGGVAAAVEKASKAAIAKGARRVLPLNVSGPFHTSLLSPAAERLAEKLRDIKINKLNIPVIFNSTARPLQNDETIARLLTRQVMSPVYFEDSIRYMEQTGVTTVIEIGPGKVLSGFVRKTAPSISVLSVEDAATMEAAIAIIKKQEVI